MIRRMWMLAILAGQLGCGGKAIRMQATGLPLEEASWVAMDWVTTEACANYFLFIRLPQNAGGGSGYLPGGGVIGGSIPDPDSAEALFQAMKELETATHLLNPRFEVQTKGPVPFLGNRCSTVRVRGLSVAGSSKSVDGPGAKPAAKPVDFR